MPGMVIFHSLQQALEAGYQICERTSTGYLARIRTNHGWAMALIDLSQDDSFKR